jgi:toxin ParE1/3/4
VRSKPVVTRHLADEDIDRAFEYYLREAGPDIAVAFIDELERSTSHLSRFPLSGSPHLGHVLNIPGIRQWPLQRFPYSIVYIDTEYSVEIWRVLHGKMDMSELMTEDE